MIQSEFRCLRCNHYWVGMRYLFDNEDRLCVATRDCPGPTDCLKCHSRYVVWVSMKEDMAALDVTPCPHWDDHPAVDLNASAAHDFS